MKLILSCLKSAFSVEQAVCTLDRSWMEGSCKDKDKKGVYIGVNWCSWYILYNWNIGKELKLDKQWRVDFKISWAVLQLYQICTAQHQITSQTTHLPMFLDT